MLDVHSVFSIYLYACQIPKVDRVRKGKHRERDSLVISTACVSRGSGDIPTKLFNLAHHGFLGLKVRESSDIY